MTVETNQRLCRVCDKPLPPSCIRKKIAKCNNCYRQFGIDSRSWCVYCKARVPNVVAGRCPQHVTTGPYLSNRTLQGFLNETEEGDIS